MPSFVLLNQNTTFVFSICSTYILITPAVEQMLYGRYLFGQQTGEWVPYEALTPTEKMTVWLRRLRGEGGALWVSKCHMVWSI